MTFLAKDQNALLDIFKSDSSSTAPTAAPSLGNSTSSTGLGNSARSTTSRSLALVEKLHQWQNDFWPEKKEKSDQSGEQSRREQRVKLDSFMTWIKSELKKCKKDANGSLDHCFIHDSLYLDFAYPALQDTTLEASQSTHSMVGVFVKDRLEKGELLLKLPSEMMLIASDTLSLILKVMSHECLAGSAWRPYLDVLPRSFDTLPMFWSLDQLLLLKGTSVFEEAVQDVVMSFKQYLIISQVVAQRKNMDLTIDLCTWNLFRWSRAIALTRQNPIKQLQADGETVKTLYGLIPLYDFFNHQPGQATAMFDIETMMLDMCLEADCDPNEQVFMSYGSRSNKQLFIYSGFIDKLWTSNDCIPISLLWNQKDPLLSKKERLLDMMMLPKKGNVYLYDLHHSQSAECLQCLIIMHLDEDHLSSFISRIEKDVSIELDLVSELQTNAKVMNKVWQWLAIRLQVSLKTTKMAHAKSREMATVGNVARHVKVLVDQLFELDVALLESLIEQVKINLG